MQQQTRKSQESKYSQRPVSNPELPDLLNVSLNQPRHHSTQQISKIQKNVIQKTSERRQQCVEQVKKGLQKKQLIPSAYILKKFLQQTQKFLQSELQPLITRKQNLCHPQYAIKKLKYIQELKNNKQQKKKDPIQKQNEQFIQLRKNLNIKFQKVEPIYFIQHGQLFQLRKKLNRRIQRLESTMQNGLIIVSDLLTFYIPSLASIYMAMHIYIRKWKQTNDIQAKNDFCKNIIAQRSEQKKTKILPHNQQPTQLNILKAPLTIIYDLVDKFAEMNQYYQQMEQIYLKMINQTKDEKEQKQIMRLLNLSQLQPILISTRVTQIQKYLHQIDSGQHLDPQVYKKRLIVEQFPRLQTKNNPIKKFCFKIKFIVMLKARCKKAEKNLKKRVQALYQLIRKQKQYIIILEKYIKQVKYPIQNLNILSSQQHFQLFCNIQQIKGFHQILYNDLKKRTQKHHKYTKYGDIIKNMIPFFKYYVDYIYIAQGAQKFLIKLMKQNEKVEQICKNYQKTKFSTAPNELMQPTFKIARYQMMFSQIIKPTNPKNQDHRLLIEAKQLFIKNLTQVNDTVDKIIRRNKLNQMQQQFGSQDEPIFKQNRQYLSQFNCFVVKELKIVAVIIFCFTDLIIVAEELTRKKIRYIIVDEKFYVRREDDNKIYRNVIKLHSVDGFMTLTTGNEDKNFQKAEELFKILSKIQKTDQSSLLVYVQVLGTQQIGSTSFAKYTEYIIEVKFLSLKKLLHLRFSDIANIVKVMQDHYNNKLSITQDECLKKTWFNNHKSKTIQDRKRTIQQILQKLFNHQVIRRLPGFLLQYVNLPQNFFQLARKISFQRTSSLVISNLLSFPKSQKSQISSPSLISKNNNFLSRRQLKQALTILCATELKLGRDIYHNLDETLQGKKEMAEKVQIYINTMKEDQQIMVIITQFDTVEDVCSKVSRLMGLRSNRDFRLVHQIGKKQLRVLQHEQLMLKLFTFPKPSKNQFSLNLIDSMASSIKKIISPQNHPTLIFKKYYFLPFQIQQHQTKKDLTRLRLLTYQVFAQVKDMKYQLNFDQYLLFAALLIYVEHDGQISKKSIEPDIIHRIIPQTIFKLKNYTQKEWLQKIQSHLQRLEKQVKKVIQYNKQQMKFNKIRTDSHAKMALYFGHRHLASQIVLNKIKSNPIYGSNLFYVQPYKKTYQQLKQKESLKIAYNMWLAVKVDSLSLLTPSSKQSQFQLKYSQIDKINVYSQAIVFKTDDYTNKEYRFNTYQSFQISQLVKYYKVLNEVLKELGENQDLASKVKLYRDQVNQYRSTYSELQDNRQSHLE